MTEQIDYSKVDWTGLKLPYGFELQIKTDSIFRWVSCSLSAEIFTLVASGHIGLNCARLADFAKASECVGLIDAHAQKWWLAKQNIKRTELVRLDSEGLRLTTESNDLHFPVFTSELTFLLSEPIKEKVYRALTTVERGPFEIIINKLG